MSYKHMIDPQLIRNAEGSLSQWYELRRWVRENQMIPMEQEAEVSYAIRVLETVSKNLKEYNKVQALDLVSNAREERINQLIDDIGFDGEGG